MAECIEIIKKTLKHKMTFHKHWKNTMKNPMQHNRK